jgi:hypothetical protein
MLKKYLRRLLARFPYGCGFDSVYIFLIFVYAHGRVPRRSGALFNDYLYSLKRSNVLLDNLPTGDVG